MWVAEEDGSIWKLPGVNRVRWCMPVTPPTQNAEARKQEDCDFKANPRKAGKTLSQNNKIQTKGLGE
jgi:hypothetical protein